MQALPQAAEQESQAALPPNLAQASLRPVPVGRWRRLRLLGTLQAQIGAAYLFYWIRGWFSDADEQERRRAEAHWQIAARLLDSMGYMRGAVMKIGQTLANFPDIAPGEFVETLDRLYFQAPPMHFSLLREMVANELGDDPEKIFDTFDKRAFAAASLGQVHRARFQDGTDLAVKIQYPGIARTVREDFRNFFLFLLPGRLNKDWQSTRGQFEDVRMRLERETDYRTEASVMARAATLFREEDQIVVPRVFSKHSTERVLTMEYLPGVHIEQFLAGNPPQELRDEFARKIVRAWYRMMYAARIFYADLHPGNFLFMDDGRLGVIDFGFMLELDDALWQSFRRMDRAMTTGRREDRIAAVSEWSSITNDPADADFLRLCDEYAEWCWRCRYRGGVFDFGDEADFRRGIDLFTEMVRKRYARAHPTTPTISRQQFGLRSLLYRLRAKIDVRTIAEEEVRATGWDRSDYG
jgi:predicted unusual protein kinase regulating ubiquinone biosynthesis (AarF/ABC1/UbiB family)